MDLAEFLGLKEDVFTKLNETINEEASLIDPQDLVAFSSRKERDERVRSNSTQREQKEMVNKLLEGQEQVKPKNKMEQLANAHLQRQAKSN